MQINHEQINKAGNYCHAQTGIQTPINLVYELSTLIKATKKAFFFVLC
jgi:hypothetical protein